MKKKAKFKSLQSVLVRHIIAFITTLIIFLIVKGVFKFLGSSVNRFFKILIIFIIIYLVINLTIYEHLKKRKTFSILRESENELEKKDKLLNGISKASNILLQSSNYRLALGDVFKILGEITEVDLIYTYESSSNEETNERFLVQRGLWCKYDIDISSGREEAQKKTWECVGISKWFDILSSGRVVSCLVKDLPQKEMEYYQSKGVLSVLIMPIIVENKFWGVIGFEDNTREHIWCEAEKNTLTIAAASIGGVFNKIREEEAIAKAIRDDLRTLAYYDSVTGLPNRTLFFDELSSYINEAEKNNTMMAILFLDFDRFKMINDTLGHDVGDMLLKKIGERLKCCVEKEVVVSRMGGDEFIILIPKVLNIGEVDKQAQKILVSFSEPIMVDQHELFITTSIGISMYPFNGTENGTLIKDADIAMYRAKEKGGNNYEFYVSEMNESHLERLELENYLRRALEKNELFLVYQPKVSLNTGKIIGAEALIRWNHTLKGIVSPADFIPLAEETGLIVPIGEWVIRTACFQMKQWIEKGYDNLRVSINISPQQFLRGNLVQAVEGAITDAGISGSSLDLEITESCLMENSERNLEIVRRLKDIRVDILVDDFGKGFSSLSYLRQFDVDVLKIDSSFIKDIPFDSNDMSITSAIISMAHDLNLYVIAEGVETKEQLDFLISKNCDEMQGYYFSKPVSSKEFEKMVEENVQLFDE
jgi:diguanylate cyclase (GGDEF)-like protein